MSSGKLENIITLGILLFYICEAKPNHSRFLRECSDSRVVLRVATDCSLPLSNALEGIMLVGASGKVACDFGLGDGV